jgi:predicted metal-binding protein
VGGRSLSIDDAIDMWGSSGYQARKGRVRVCKSCYRKWKKENKNDDMY